MSLLVTSSSTVVVPHSVQAMRQQLRDDFATMKAVLADPRLVNPSHQLKKG